MHSLLGAILIGSIFLGACNRASVETRQPAPRASIALRVGRVLDPVTGRYSEPTTILVTQGRIAGMLPSDRYRTDMADSTLDLRELTVLPGFIDAHVHLAIGNGVAASALADLRAGFTTIVDLGSRTTRLLQLRDSINAGFIPGPRVLAAGVWVGTKDGVCEFSGIGIAGGPEAFGQRAKDNIDGG